MTSVARVIIALSLLLWPTLAYCTLALAADGIWPLCNGHHVAKRPPDCARSLVPGCIAYGGLPERRGFQRDHWTYPHCLGQQDDASHVRYQPMAEARDKDRLEKHACDAYCGGMIDLPAARALFDDWPRSYQNIYGEYPPHAKEGAKDR